jgi:hypothetical protein
MSALGHLRHRGNYTVGPMCDFDERLHTMRQWNSFTNKWSSLNVISRGQSCLWRWLAYIVPNPNKRNGDFKHADTGGRLCIAKLEKALYTLVSRALNLSKIRTYSACQADSFFREKAKFHTYRSQQSVRVEHKGATSNNCHTAYMTTCSSPVDCSSERSLYIYLA